MIASVRSKSAYFGPGSGNVFLSWIGFGHIASLMELHIHAMYLCAPMVHIPALPLIADPLRLFRLIELHRVTYSFAPQFYLAKLLRSVRSLDQTNAVFNIRCLRHLISGGESNLVETIV